MCMLYICFFFFKQKTAYEMRISDWSSDVCSSDLRQRKPPQPGEPRLLTEHRGPGPADPVLGRTLVDPGGDAHPAGSRRQPRAKGRTGGQAGGQLHIARRNRWTDGGVLTPTPFASSKVEN